MIKRERLPTYDLLLHYCKNLDQLYHILWWLRLESAVFMEAANNMEDTSLLMEWAMDTLLQEEEEPAALYDGCGEAVAVFPSLQGLRDASHAAEMVRELMAAVETDDAANSWTTSGSGGEVTDGGSSGATDPAAPAAAEAADFYGGSGPPHSPNSFPSGKTNTSLPTVRVSWNFVTGSAAAQPRSDGVLEEGAVPIRRVPPELAHRRRSPPPPPRRAHHPTRGMGAASCTPEHIVAERKRREKINNRLIELSTVIPGLKKVLSQSQPIHMN